MPWLGVQVGVFGGLSSHPCTEFNPLTPGFFLHQRQGHRWSDCCQPEGEFSVLILLDSSLAFDVPDLPAIIFQFTQFINLLLFEEGVLLPRLALTSRLAEGDFQLLTTTFVSQIPGSQVCSTVSIYWFHILCVRIYGIQEFYWWATPRPPLCSWNNSLLGHLELLWILPPCPSEAPICSWELGKALDSGPCSSVLPAPEHASVKGGNYLSGLYVLFSTPSLYRQSQS